MVAGSESGDSVLKELAGILCCLTGGTCDVLAGGE